MLEIICLIGATLLLFIVSETSCIGKLGALYLITYLIYKIVA